MGTTVPCSPPALNEAKNMDKQSHVAHVMHDVLKPPPFDDLTFVDTTDWIVGHQAWLIRPVCPRLLVVHDAGNFVVVRPDTILLDVVAAGGEWFHSIVRENRGIRMYDSMVVQFTLVTNRREDPSLQKGQLVQDHQRLIRVTSKNHIVKRLFLSVFVLYDDIG